MPANRIQAYLRAVVARQREPVRAGAFVLYVHPYDPHPFLNYAIPEPSAPPDDGKLLIDAARERGLIPRLEYIEPCFPWVEDALARTGFALEGRLRLMTCDRGAVRRPDAAVELAVVRPGEPLVAATLGAMHDAFGEPPPTEEEVARWRGPAVAALVDGSVAGAAGWTQVIDGMSEIVGVAVAEPMRRRGIGTALSVAATAAAFEDGARMALLTPGDDDTARVYERAGFRDATTMVHLRRPA